MERDFTAKILFDRLMTALCMITFCVLVYTGVGIYLVFSDAAVDYIIYFVLGYCFAIVLYLRFVIHTLVLYKHYQKIFKSAVSFYGTLDEVTYPDFFADFFLMADGARVVVDGHYSRSIYPFYVVNKLTNTTVEYILEGEKVWIVNKCDW